MAMTERRQNAPVETAATGAREPRGFRPTSRRRSRIAAGAVLAAIAIGGNVLLYTSLDDRTEVLQLARDVRAGERVTSDDLRIVEADLDATVPVVPAADIGRVVNQVARVYLPAGSLISDGVVQSTPLVAEGAGVVAVEVSPSRVPAGLTTRSLVLLVIDLGGGEPFVTSARVVRHAGGEGSSMSVEVPVDVAPVVAAADGVRLVLVEPGVDEATEAGTDGTGTETDDAGTDAGDG